MGSMHYAAIVVAANGTKLGKTQTMAIKPTPSGIRAREGDRHLWTTIRDRSHPDRPKARDVEVTPPVQGRSRIGIAGARNQQRHRPMQMPNKRNLLRFQMQAVDRHHGWHFCRCNKLQTKQPKPHRKLPMQHHPLCRHSSQRQ